MDGFISKPMEISRFLKDMLCILESPQFTIETDFLLFQREKNAKTLLLLEFDTMDVVDVVRTLGIRDYFETVRDYKNPDGTPYFVFMKLVQEQEIYIKIKTKYLPRHSILCISFHVADHSMMTRLPYGTTER